MSTPYTLPVLLALIPLTLSSCSGGGGGGGEEQAPGAQVSLEAPRGLRLRKAADASANSYRLEWEQDLLLGGAEYRVFRSSLPITEQDLDDVESTTVAGPSAPIDLPRDTGMVYVRVAPVGPDGELGELSDEVSVDTTDRLLYVESETYNDRRLYSVRADGSMPVELTPGLGLSGSDVQVSPFGDQVVIPFSRVGDSFVDVTAYSMPADGSAPPIDLFPAGTNFGSFSLIEISPDGRYVLVYAREQGAPTSLGALYVAELGVEASARRITEPGHITESSDAAFTPDSSQVLYKLRVEIDDWPWLQLHVAEVEGEVSTRRLTPESGPGAYVFREYMLSPDGLQVLYVAADNVPTSYDYEKSLYVIPLAGGDPTLIDAAGEGPLIEGSFEWGVHRPVWSPDSRWIAYIETVYVGNQARSEAKLAPADGSAAPEPLHDNLYPDRRIYQLEFSPDSQQVYYRSATTNVAQQELYVTQVADPLAVEKVSPDLPSFSSVHSYELDPTGTRVVFLSDLVADGRSELFVVDLSLLGLARRVHPQMHPDTYVSNYGFSPNGETIYFQADPAGDNVRRAYVSSSLGLAQATAVAGQAPKSVSNLRWPAPGMK